MRSKIALIIFGCLFVVSCQQPGSNGGSNNATAKPAATTSGVQHLTVIERPQKIKDQMAARGEQDSATPTLAVVEPKTGSTVNGSTVKVKLRISGDLKGYMPHMDPATQMGNHIHVILDNQPYEAYYGLDQEFELRNVADGEHTLRVFPSRPWHESYKNAGAFQMIKFTVKSGEADASKPATTKGGETMGETAPTLEGKEMAESTGGGVDPKKPLLTYSRPKGEYKGTDADVIMIDFWLANAKLTGDGGEYRVQYSVDGGEAKFIDKWEPIWVTGWANGKHSVKLELVDKAGNVVDNGGYNSTTREITVAK